MDSTLHIAAVATVVGTIIGWLPGLTAIFAFTWYLMLFYEKFTGKTIGKRKGKHL